MREFSTAPVGAGDRFEVNLFRVQNKGTLRNYVQSSEPPNMVCNLPTLVCRYLILYFQHPTTVKNHLHFHTFLPKSLHNPNKCLTFAAPEPPSLLTMLKSGVVLFLYHYEIIGSWGLEHWFMEIFGG